MSTADDCKARGNNHLRAREYEQAVAAYSEGLEIDPSHHVLYSNRAAAYINLQKATEALEDAESCIKCNPAFVKGFLRKATALKMLGRTPDAVDAIEAGLQIQPEFGPLKSLQQEIMSEQQNRMQGLFSNPRFLELMQDPEVAEAIQDPTKLQEHMGNPKVLEAVMMLQGMMGGMPGAPQPGAPQPGAPQPGAPQPQPAPKPQPKPEPKSEPKIAVKTVEEEADEIKAEGNKLFKNKNYDGAIDKYREAYAKHPNPVYLSNIAAVHTQRKEFDIAIEITEEMIEKARELCNGEYISKGLERMGNIKKAMGEVEEAVKFWKDADLEFSHRKLRVKIREGERDVRAIKKKAYVDPELSQAAKQRGNELFAEEKFVEAIQQYEEAIKRDPTSHTAVANRGLCKLRLGDFMGCVKDCDDALEIDPTYIKALIRAAQAYQYMAMYHKSLEYYKRAQALEPSEHSVLQGMQELETVVQRMQMKGPDEEMVRRNAEMPSIKKLVTDPGLQHLLQEISTNPAAMMQAMSTPGVADSLQMLIYAGVLRTQGPIPRSQ
ncbi:hypothetical protein PCE1_004893 [Barthelona sp. PCE]